MPEANLQLVRDALKVLGQEFMAERPGRLDRRPGPAVLFIGAHQHAVAFLANVDLAIEIDAVHQLATGRLVEVDDLGHVLGDQIHVLHGENRQLQPDHAPHFTGPETGRIHHMFAADLALVRDHPPGSVGKLHQILDLGVQIDLGTVLLGRFRIGMGCAVGVEMALMRIEHGAHELRRVEQRHHRMRFLDRDEPRFTVCILALGKQRLEPVEPLRRRRQHQAGGHVQADILTGIGLDLLVEFDRVFLQLGNVRIAVDRMHAPCCMPGGAGGEFRTLEQNDIAPAELGQMVEDRTSDDTATDDDNSSMAFHGSRSHNLMPVWGEPRTSRELPIGCSANPDLSFPT